MYFETVKEKVIIALKMLRNHDQFLLDANTNERTISHKLAEYLQKEFSEWTVDCEYNRHGKEVKMVDLPKDNIHWGDTEAKTVFPDIVIHERDMDDSNLLVIEIKKSSNRISRQLDKNKIIAFTKEPYNYKFGLLIEVDVNGKNDLFERYEDGKKYENQN